MLEDAGMSGGGSWKNSGRRGFLEDSPWTARTCAEAWLAHSPWTCAGEEMAVQALRARLGLSPFPPKVEGAGSVRKEGAAASLVPLGEALLQRQGLQAASPHLVVDTARQHLMSCPVSVAASLLLLPSLQSLGCCCSSNALQG